MSFNDPTLRPACKETQNEASEAFTGSLILLIKRFIRWYDLIAQDT